MEPNQLLEKILERIEAVKNGGGNPLVVFDLDGTLFDNGPRTWKLVTEALEEGGYTDERQRLSDVSNRMLPYLVSDFLNGAGITDESIIQYATDYWFKGFFTDAYQKLDVPLEGSVDFANKIYDAGATLVYLTGRDVPGMLVGCTDALRSGGFPVGLVRTMMVLKPDFETKDLAFKTEAADFISQTGTVVAGFDNEPGNCNLFLDKWPEAYSVFLDTTCAPNPPALNPEAIVIKNFL